MTFEHTVPTNISDLIAKYLTDNPEQRVLSVGGISAALHIHFDHKQAVIDAALQLSAPPHSLLEARFRLYDIRIESYKEELSLLDYNQALSDGYFVDIDGHEIDIEEFKRRALPFFTRRTET